MSQRLLLVDDEPTQLTLLQGVLSKEGYDIEKAFDGDEAVARLTAFDAPSVDLMVLDLAMPKMDGIEVLKQVRPTHPDLPIIVLTAHSSVQNVVEAMRRGASDFLVKPASAERVRSAVANALNHEPLVGEIQTVRSLDKANGFEGLIGESERMVEAVAVARKAARTSIPVLIEGESGVGKEMFARAIHQESERHNKPFIAVNCGAIPENLVESILFGHEKGAFTGATEKHAGKFVEANGGTLFLDEVGELPLDVQVKLLRAIQEGEVDPVGARQPVKVDIRLISATNRDMLNHVAAGAFREDLYYRLGVFPLRLPALRDRSGDIPALAHYFIERIAKAEKLQPRPLSNDAMALLKEHHWPGNIRQLQNAIYRAAILADGDELKPSDFPQILAQAQRRVADAFASRDGGVGNDNNQPGDRAMVLPPDMAGLLHLFDNSGEFRRLSDIEADVIKWALEKYDGRMSEVARRLGIGRSTLYRKVAEFGLDQADGDASENVKSA